MRIWEIIETTSSGNVASVSGGFWTGPVKDTYPYVVPDMGKKKKSKSVKEDGEGGDGGEWSGNTDSSQIATYPMPLWYGPMTGAYPYQVPAKPKKKRKKKAKKRVKEEALTELTRPEYRSDYTSILSSGGWKPIGSGIYADVYGKPGVDYVLKVFTSSDVAYQDYLDLIRQHPNPHFPTVKGKLVRINDYYYAVRLERLKPLKVIKFGKYSAYKLIEEWLSNEDDQMYQDEMDGTEEMFTRYPKLKEALTLIRDKLNHHYIDLHPDNLMMRGRDIVIIDPVQ